MARVEKIKVSIDKNQWRLDKFLSSQLTDISRSQVASWVKKSLVKVNGCLKKSSYILQTGDEIELVIPTKDNSLKPYNFLIPIIWEDDDLLVVNKPQGLVVHPHGQNKEKTLVNALLYLGKNLSQVSSQRPGIIHRLDKETSGVMILAKNDFSHKNLVNQFKERSVEKEYRALVWGHPKDTQFQVRLPLGRKEKNRLKMEVKLTAAKEAITKFKVLASLDKMTYLAVFPKTGRMHQIRVHLRFLGLPLVGDKKYGRKDSYKHLFLHAYRIKLKHPREGRILDFTCKLPDHFVKMSIPS